MLNIIYLGNFGVDFSTESHIAKTLSNMGHNVIRIQEDSATTDGVLNAISASNADFFLWTRTPGFFRGDGFELIRRIKEAGITTVSYHLDLYCGISREESIPFDAFWRSDYCFTPDGSDESAIKFKNFNVNHYYSPPAVFDKECYLAEPNKNKYPQDVIFVGSYSSYHHEHMYRIQLVNWLKETYGDKFGAYPLPNQGHIRGHDLNTLYASAKVSVGDSLIKNFIAEKYWSDRTPETLGRSNILFIHPYVKGMDDFYKDKEHLVYYQFNDFSGLKKTIDFYLGSPDERSRIGSSGHEFVKSSQTYTQRMENLINVVINGKDNIYK